MIPTPNERPTVSIAEAAEWLGISRSHAYQLASDGGLPVLRLGTTLRVVTRDLRRMLGLADVDEGTS